MNRFGHDVIIDQSTMQNDRTVSSESRLKRRISEEIREHVDDLMKTRGVTDLASSGPIKVKVDLDEPSFEFDRETGKPAFVIVGNPIYKKGDKIPKPPRGWTTQRGNQGSPDGEGEDDFVFTIDSAEVQDQLFDELELPNLEDRILKRRTLESRQHAGYTNEGPPATLDLSRTMVRSIGRRIALRRPSIGHIKELEEKILFLESLPADAPEREQLAELRTTLARARLVRKVVPYLDRPDLQHRRSEIVTEPVTSAVVFGLMDVSVSMREHHKELAKRFFWLLRLFLMREYDEVQMVWIRHTQEAEEVDDREFFFGQSTGGTVVSSALEKMIDIRKERFPLDQYNIYMCQASDGDAGVVYSGATRRPVATNAYGMGSDAEYSKELLEHEILPIVQYGAYLECRDPSDRTSRDMETELWDAYDPLREDCKHFAMQRVFNSTEIYPVFRNLFLPV